MGRCTVFFFFFFCGEEQPSGHRLMCVGRAVSFKNVNLPKLLLLGYVPKPDSSCNGLSSVAEMPYRKGFTVCAFAQPADIEVVLRVWLHKIMTEII